MIDIKLLRENPSIILDDLKKRGDKEKIKLVNELLKKDKEYRAILKNLEDLRHEKNSMTREIDKIRKEGKDISSNIKTMKIVSEKIKNLETKIQKFREEINRYLMGIPNILHSSVPIGKDDNDNKVIRKWGKIKDYTFKPKSHVDILQDLNLADITRAGKISGARFYFLTNELVLLDLALMKFAMDVLVKKGFKPVEPPFMMRREPYEGVTDIQDFETMMYKIENEDLYLIATSEHPMASMYMKEILDEKELPIKFAGISPCFRKEAGAHGRDTKGIWRVHHFNKIEMFVFSKPEDSWKMHEELIKTAEELLKKLELPYRLVNVCTGDIGSVAAKKYDLEVWLPTQNKYREVISCSNCTDYQARRLNIRYGIEGEKPKGFIHTLNSTALATTRTIVAILEKYQQKDGSVKIPTALVPYMNGLKKIG